MLSIHAERDHLQPKAVLSEDGQNYTVKFQLPQIRPHRLAVSRERDHLVVDVQTAPPGHQGASRLRRLLALPGDVSGEPIYPRLEGRTVHVTLGKQSVPS